MILMAALICSGLKLAGVLGVSWGFIWGWTLVAEATCLAVLFLLKGLR